MNKKQQRFADEYLIDLNATQAALRAGYSEKTSYAQGHRLLKNAEIQNYIAEKQREIQDANIASIRDVEEYLSKMMNGEIDEEKLVFNEGEPTTARVQAPASARNKAAELLGRRYAMFTDKQEVDTNQQTIIFVDDLDEVTADDTT